MSNQNPTANRAVYKQRKGDALQRIPLLNLPRIIVRSVRTETYQSLSFEPSTLTILWMYIFFMFSRAGVRYWRGSK